MRNDFLCVLGKYYYQSNVHCICKKDKIMTYSYEISGKPEITNITQESKCGTEMTIVSKIIEERISEPATCFVYLAWMNYPNHSLHMFQQIP